MAPLKRFWNWFICGFEPGERAPAEVIVLRCFGVASLILVLGVTLTTHPHAAFRGRGLVILLATLGLFAAVLASQPQKGDVPVWRRCATLMAVAGCSAVLLALKDNGIWQAGLYGVALIAAVRLERREGVAVVVGSIAVLTIGAVIAHRVGLLFSVSLGAIPWYLIIRLFSRLHEQNEQLEASRAAEADAATAAERGRIAREMHDVLAHSLSALALQLESTRLLARNRQVDSSVAAAIDRAHHIAASGLQEARRAIAAERGDEAPGPERLGLLAEAFGEQSGLPVAVEVRGEPRELAPEARLAVYRTAQEALTNVRRHATAERVRMELDYLPDRTVLVVEDQAVHDAPPPAALALTGGGYGLTGMRERAELLGGELIATPTTRGFRVELRLPVSA